MSLPPEVKREEQPDEEDRLMQEWIEEKRKKELERWRNYYAN